MHCAYRHVLQQSWENASIQKAIFKGFSLSFKSNLIPRSLSDVSKCFLFRTEQHSVWLHHSVCSASCRLLATWQISGEPAGTGVKGWAVPRLDSLSTALKPSSCKITRNQTCLPQRRVPAACWTLKGYSVAQADRQQMPHQLTSLHSGLGLYRFSVVLTAVAWELPVSGAFPHLLSRKCGVGPAWGVTESVIHTQAKIEYHPSKPKSDFTFSICTVPSQNP